MWGHEVLSVVVELVVLNDYETSYRGEYGYIVESSVGVCSLRLLLSGMRGLEDKDALDEEEHGGRIKEL